MSTNTVMTSAPTEQPQTAQCWHCASPVPSALIDQQSEQQFCCSGCRTAYSIIHECGLDRYYALRDGAFSPSSESRSSTYEEMDDPTFHALHVATNPDGVSTVRLFLQGAHCAACVWLIERLPTILDGVEWTRLNLTRSTAEIRWRNDQVKLSRIAKMLESLGYPAHPLTDASKAEANRREDRRQLARLAVAGACAGNNMLIAFALYAGTFTGMAADHLELFRWVSTLIGLISLTWPGSVFFKGAWTALRTRTTHLDIPLALGLGAGGIAGLVNTIRGTGDIYFDSLSVLVFFLLVGRWIQFRQQRRAADSVSMLKSLTPRFARRVTDAKFSTIPIEAIQEGDLLEVRVGELVPADGTIIKGRSTIDEAILTGESKGRAVTVESSILAGSTNLSAPIQIRVSATGQDARIGKLMQLVEDASLLRAPIVALAHRVSGYFVLTVTILSLVTAVYWYATGSSLWLDHAIALLVVSCPCSLGLATPLAIAVAQGRAAKRSILIKGGEVIERLSSPASIWLDKTGTITEGKMRLVDWNGPRNYLPKVAAIETFANHPIAQSILDAAEEVPGDIEVGDFHQTMGAGVSASISGQRYVIGSVSFIKREGIVLHAAHEIQVAKLLQRGLTPVLVAIDTSLEVIAGIGDEIRPDAIAAIRELTARHWQVGILSGDDQRIVEQVASKVGIPSSLAKGGLLPEDKLRIVQQSAAKGTVVMVGDGVNDSAALAAATVGVAVKGGAEASLHAAPVYLAGGSLGTLVQLIDASRQTMRVIHRNFAVSLGYNAIAIGLAMGGMINPLVAALLMPASSLLVVASSVMSGTFTEREKHASHDESPNRLAPTDAPAMAVAMGDHS
ncbi:cation-translocating P-type ATPase [bacterium]|nr:cation-translocating P-type ATPase [bacterium]